MSIGVGNTFFSQRQSGGATATYQNGLTEIAGVVEWDGQLVKLTTVIDLNNLELYFQTTGTAKRYIELSPGANRYSFGLLDSNTNINQCISFEQDTTIIYGGSLGEIFRSTTSLELFELGTIVGGNAGTGLSMDGTNEDVYISNNNLFVFRSVAGATPSTIIRTKGANGVQLRVENNTKLFIFEAAVGGGAALNVNGVTGITGAFAVGANTITVNGGIITAIV